MGKWLRDSPNTDRPAEARRAGHFQIPEDAGFAPCPENQVKLQRVEKDRKVMQGGTQRLQRQGGGTGEGPGEGERRLGKAVWGGDEEE